MIFFWLSYEFPMISADFFAKRIRIRFMTRIRIWDEEMKRIQPDQDPQYWLKKLDKKKKFIPKKSSQTTKYIQGFLQCSGRSESAWLDYNIEVTLHLKGPGVWRPQLSGRVGWLQKIGWQEGAELNSQFPGQS